MFHLIRIDLMKLFNKTLSSDSHLHTNNLKSKSEIADDHKKIHMQIETEFHLRPSFTTRPQSQLDS